MESEKSVAGGRFASAREADRRIAGVAAAARLVRRMADSGAREVRLGIGDSAALDPATLVDIERVRGAAAVRIERGADAAALPEAPPMSAWRIVRATGKPSDGIVARWLNRPISRPITWLVLAVADVRPVHATAATVLVALAMFAALLSGSEAGLVLGALLFQAASVIDGVDGEIARATFRVSAVGAALDSAVDLGTNFLFISGLTVALALRDGPFIGWVGGWGLCLFATGAVLIGWAPRRPSFDLVKKRYSGRRDAGRVAILLRAAMIVTSRDFFALLFLLLILAGLEVAIPYLVAAAATIWLPFVAVAARDSAVQHRRLTSPENVTTV